MKKTLVTLLALVFVLGIAATAFAAPANPFVDVPAKHWAYGAVAKLVKAGVVDGYGDGTFRGDRAMTRYEMAQVVAKAMAKSDKADAEMKALIDKLAVEFAAELNNLGVRVAKLEKNASSIKFWGDSRLRYIDNGGVRANGTYADGVDKDFFQERFRIAMSANPADNVKMEARMWVQNKSNVENTIAESGSFGLDYGKFTFKEAIAGLDIQIGRDFNLQGYGITSNPTGGFDGVKLFGGGNEVKFMLGAGDISANGNGAAKTAANTMYATANKEGLWEANIVWTPNKDFQLLGSTMRSTSDGWKFDIYTLGAKIGLGSDMAFTTEWAHNSNQKAYDKNQRNAWFAQLGYKGAKAAEVGSFGLYLNYKKYGNSAVDYRLQSIPIFEAISDNFVLDNGARGWGVGFDYTLAKNTIFRLTYEDLKAYQGNLKHGSYTYAQINVFF